MLLLLCSMLRFLIFSRYYYVLTKSNSPWVNKINSEKTEEKFSWREVMTNYQHFPSFLYVIRRYFPCFWCFFPISTFICISLFVYLNFSCTISFKTGKIVGPLRHLQHLFEQFHVQNWKFFGACKDFLYLSCLKILISSVMSILIP